ncbi:hypothetical protein BH11ARM2_BH11ARM2_29580 [soil metagenome]
MDEPRLRRIEKYPPPFKLNEFPKEVLLSIAKDLLLAKFMGATDFRGDDWEKSFALAIGATWKPSNVGLDDVVLHRTAWGAKTVKASKPFMQKSVRLISGRNSIDYSFGRSDSRQVPVQEIASMVLGIWNRRVKDIRASYPNLRTAVLLKGNSLSEVAVFEFVTIEYEAENYTWSWNKRNNLEGHDSQGNLVFTWQPHGVQFTITHPVPVKRHCLRISLPAEIPFMNRDEVLEGIGFQSDWIEII